MQIKMKLNYVQIKIGKSFAAYFIGLLIVISGISNPLQGNLAESAEKHVPDHLSNFDQEVSEFWEMHNLDEKEKGFFVVKNVEDEREIFRTARVLHVGDEYIDQNNRHFRIVNVTDDVAWAELINNQAASNQVITLLEYFRTTNVPQEEYSLESNIPTVTGNTKLAVYHSHGAEAYEPSDGEDFIEEGGGIIKVGKRFAHALEEEGFEVIHSTKTHVPHDAGAYARSRRTKEELIKEDPGALFDVHRDAVPAEEYLEEVEGEEMVQVLLVVGRQNQNVSNNMQFAEELKATADEKYPGLVKGILKAQGSYNQDLSPRSILLEIGGNENKREDAEDSAEVFAGVVGGYVGGSPGGAEGGEAAPGRSTVAGEGGIAAAAALWFVVIVVVAALIFVVISAGGWENAKKRIRHFFTREFADILNGGKKKK